MSATSVRRRALAAGTGDARGVRWVAACGVFGFGLLTAGVSAQDLPNQPDALRGLMSPMVEVQLVGTADRIGIDAAVVQASVEARLSESGLRARGEDETPVRGDPRLRVTLHAIDAAGGYAFMVSVQLLERMVSIRRYVDLVLAGELPTGPADSIEPLDLMQSVRWQARALGTTSAERAQVFIPESVLGYVDRFVEDYRSANPM